MKRNLTILALAAFFAVAWTAVCFAGGPEGGNERKGKYTYRKIYNSCANRGEVESRSPVINPSDKTMAQWDRIFQKKDFSDFKCRQEWDKLSEQDLLDIYAYLYKHAADSPTPAKCK
jgi:hypothetical protein